MKHNAKQIIILASIRWHALWQRPQALAKEFSRMGYQVFYIEPSGVRSFYDEYKLHISDWQPHVLIKEGITIISPPLRWLPTGRSLLGLDYLNQRLRFSWIKKTLSGFDIREPILMVQSPTWKNDILSGLNFTHSILCYDCCDDYTNFSWARVHKNLVLAEESLFKESHLVFVTSRLLAEKASTFTFNFWTIPNGVSDTFFVPPQRTPEDLDRIPRPRIGFVGAMGPWVNTDLINSAAINYPSCSFVFIGPIKGKDIKRKNLMHNIHFLGHKPHHAVPSYISHLDVCLIPFAAGNISLAADPIKLYEYLSLGKPVVTSGIQRKSSEEDLVYYSTGEKEFLENIEEALQEKNELLANRRKEYARRHTWSVRARQMENIIMEYRKNG